jgi:hypothetical protein
MYIEYKEKIELDDWIIIDENRSPDVKIIIHNFFLKQILC